MPEELQISEEKKTAGHQTNEIANLLNAVLNSKRVEVGNVEIVRDGDQIILPKNMSYDSAIEWLNRKKQSEEAVVEIHHDIPGYPLDGIYALSKAFERRFGFTDMVGEKSAFNNRPPKLIKICTGFNDFVQVPYCKVVPPTWEEGYLQPAVYSPQSLHVSGQIKKKFEPEVRELLAAAEKIVREQSIYKGKAIKLDLAYLDELCEGDPFNPDEHAPEFMDISNIGLKDLILNDTTQFALNTNIFVRITNSAACLRNGMPLKHGALLAGPYGCGKTLTAKVTSRLAVDNGWTFIYLKSASHIARALQMAKLYSPSVLFCEDIDQVVKGNDRDEEMNTILNTLDGVDTKTAPIITILTTNHLETINPGFLRAGRIDSVIHMTPPDEKTAYRFIELYAKNAAGESLLSPDIDSSACGKAFAQLAPAFIAEGIQKGKSATIYRIGHDDIVGQMITEDIVGAASLMKGHIELVNRKVDMSNADRVVKVVEALGQALQGEEVTGIE